MEVFRTATAVMIHSFVLNAQSAGRQRLLLLQQAAAVEGEAGEPTCVRDRDPRLKSENRPLKAAPRPESAPSVLLLIPPVSDKVSRRERQKNRVDPAAMATTTESRALSSRLQHIPAAALPRWAAGAAFVLVLMVSIAVAARFSRGETGDMRTWYDVGRRVLAGETLVGLPEYRYPPTFAVLTAPLAALPFGVFCFLWYAINLGLFVASMRLALRLTFPAAETIPVQCYWLPGLLVAVFAVDNLILGQTNILIMALLYWSLLETSRSRGWLAGVPLGAAIAIKAFVLPVLGYFAYRRQFGALASGLCSLAFFLWLLPAPVRGFQRNVSEVNLWTRRVVLPYLAHAQPGDWGHHGLDYENQSLCAETRRILTPVDAYPEERHSPTPLRVNVANLTERQVSAGLWVMFAVLAAVFAVACKWQRPTDKDQEVLEYALVTVAVLLVSAITWSYFFVTLLLPVTAALRLLRSQERLSKASAWALRLALGGLVLATLLLLDAHVRALGNLCWAAVLWFTALALACRDLRTTGGHHAAGCQALAQEPR